MTQNTSESFINREFWHNSGSVLSEFQSHVNDEDWFKTVAALGQIAGSVTKSLRGQFDCIDYGAGFCHTLRDIIGHIHYHQQVPTRWHAYEPDADLVNLVRQKTLPEAGSDPPNHGLLSISDCMSKVFNREHNSVGVITLIHSIYYVEDAVDLIRRLLRLVVPGGEVVVLRLAPTSPFYVVKEKVPRNGTYRIEQEFDATIIEERKSRVRLLPEVLSSERFLRNMWQLRTSSSELQVCFPEYKSAFVRTFGSGRIVDLNDQVLRIQKQAT